MYQPSDFTISFTRNKMNTNTSAMRESNTSSRERLLIKANYQVVPIMVRDILFVKALSDYVIIKTINTKYITLCTMKEMMDSLPEEMFVRTHRSFIVNVDKILNVKGSFIEINEKDMQFSIPIGRAYKKDFRTMLNAA